MSGARGGARPLSIGLYVHHHGSGHLNRSRRIAHESDAFVTGLSSLPRPADWPGDWVDLPLDTDTGTDAPGAEGHGAAEPGARVAAERDAGGVLHWAPLDSAGYATRMGRIAEWIDRARPDLLYVDVSVEVALLARLLGVPVAVSAMRGDRDDRPHRAAYDAARVLVAPWPAASPEPGRPAGWDAKTVFTGGISRFDDAAPTLDAAPGVDDGANRAAPAELTAGVGEVRPGRVCLLWGRGGGVWTAGEFAAVRAQTPGCEWEVAGQERDVWPALLDADVVVTHGGQNAVAEVAAARRPAVVVPLERPFGEQVATSAALRRSGLAVTRDDPAWTTWADALDAAHRSGGRRWRRWSDGFGAHRAARALEAAARGRQIASGTALLTLVRDRHEHLRGLVRGLAAGSHLPERFVVVSIGDPDVEAVVVAACRGTGLRPDVVVVPVADADALPLARARNAGAAAARRLGCDTLVFLDVDCIPGPGLVRAYADAVGAGRASTDPSSAPSPSGASPARPAVWSGPTTYLPPVGPDGYDLAGLAGLADPHPARPAPPAGEQWAADDLRLFWSLSFAMSADDFDAVGGFCEDYTGYGGEDTDFAMRLGEAGGRLWWLGGADAFHQYHPTTDPPVQHLDDIVRNANRFAARWGRHPMEGWLEAFAAAGLARYDDARDRWEVCDA